jgi:acyl-ACP thioesterase
MVNKMAIAMQLEENPAVFEQEFVVTEAMIDRNNHLNNVFCVQ